jgi:PTH2 family peptidyl-tRNA hydrolase
MSLKQVIVVDEQLGMSRGKLAAQASHASLNAFLNTDQEARDKWLSQGGKKIVVEKGDRKFEDLLGQAQNYSIPCAKVHDAGHTEVEPGTDTAAAIGPGKSDKIDKITSELRLLK